MTPWAGGAFGSRGRCLLAPNPGVMTLDGTNTWVLQEPGSSAAVVVDPGPLADGHLDRRGLVLRADLLGVWSAWCTPVFEPRRFRTWFFVASLPHGQRTRDVSTESSSVTWMSARAACDAVDAGELGMLPPTYFTCLEIAQYDSPEAVLDAAPQRTVEMFTPTVEGSGERATLSMPARMVPLVEARRS